MLPKDHLLIGFIFTYILIYFFQVPLLAGAIIFLSSILIDIDHYLRYIYLKKDFSPTNFWNWSMQQTKKYRKLDKKEKSKYKLPIFIFHGIEFWIIIFLLSFTNKIFLWIFLGIAFHMICDVIALVYYNDPLDLKLSQVYNFITNKNRKVFD